jgi:hypothetical protein
MSNNPINNITVIYYPNSIMLYKVEKIEQNTINQPKRSDQRSNKLMRSNITDNLSNPTMELTVQPIYRKRIIHKINLPADILRYNIEPYLMVRISNDKIKEMFKSLYDDNLKTVLFGLNFFNTYFDNLQLPYNTYRHRDCWYTAKTLGLLLMRAYYMNNMDHITLAIVEFMRNELFKKKNIRYLVDCTIELDCWDRIPQYLIMKNGLFGDDRPTYYNLYNILEAMFCIVFTPDVLMDRLSHEFGRSAQPIVRHQDVGRSTDHYLDFLKEILFDTNYQIVYRIRDYDTPTLQIVSKDLNYEYSFFEILNVLCYWKDKSVDLVQLVDQMMGRIEYDASFANYEIYPPNHRNRLRGIPEVKKIIRKSLAEKGYLLLERIIGCEIFMRYYDQTIARIFAELKPSEIDAFDEYKNIFTFLRSSVFMFCLVECRKFKLFRFLFNQNKRNKKKMALYKNKDGHNLLEVASATYGLNQNIISLMVNSKLFSTKNLKIQNRKVKLLFSSY